MYPRYVKYYPRYQYAPTTSKCTHDIKSVPHDINKTTVHSRMPKLTYNFSASYVVGNVIDVVGNIIDVVDDMYPRHHSICTHDMLSVPTICYMYPRYVNCIHDINMSPRHQYTCIHDIIFSSTTSLCYPRHHDCSHIVGTYLGERF